jgi:hypothetical protein
VVSTLLEILVKERNKAAPAWRAFIVSTLLEILGLAYSVVVGF